MVNQLNLLRVLAEILIFSAKKSRHHPKAHVSDSTDDVTTSERQ